MTAPSYATTARGLVEALQAAMAPQPSPIARVDLLKVGAYSMIRNRLQLYRPFAKHLPPGLDIAGMLDACSRRLGYCHDGNPLAVSGCGHDTHTLTPALRLKLDQARLALRWLRRFEPD